MAIHILRTRKDTETDKSIICFQCNDESDVANLPTQVRTNKGVCATGSTAIVLLPDENKSYNRRLDSDGNWVEVHARVPGVSTIIDCGSPSTAH